MDSHRYYVYILTNVLQSVLYIGVTNDIARRLHEHKTHAVPGFTDRYNVTKLVYVEEYPQGGRRDTSRKAAQEVEQSQEGGFDQRRERGLGGDRALAPSSFRPEARSAVVEESRGARFLRLRSLRSLRSK